jgi:hypothetical protein
MQAPFLLFYIIALYAGLVVPIPGVVLAWREWIKKAKTSQAKGWRRTMSQIGLVLCSLGVTAWVYIFLAEARGKLSPVYYYDSRIMHIGVFGSLTAIVACAFSEGKLRKYLLLCAVGLLCFFCFGAGEAL